VVENKGKKKTLTQQVGSGEQRQEENIDAAGE